MNTETEMQAVAEALARLGYASLAKIVKKTEKERDEEEMSDGVYVEETAETDILRLTAQRDEARAALERIQNFYRETLNEMTERLSDEVVHVNLLIEKNAEAEQRGYRKGVEDAADAIELHETNWKVGTSENKAEIRAAILALLEQTSEPGEKK